MRFPYSSVILPEPGTGDLLIMHRPEIPVKVFGSRGAVPVIGLVDTGSDYTIFPKSVAEYLDIQVQPATDSSANVFGGHSVELFSGEVELKLTGESEEITWKTMVNFFDFGSTGDQTAILGRAGFLDFFTATFDGYEAALTLLPNPDLPSPIEH